MNTSLMNKLMLIKKIIELEHVDIEEMDEQSKLMSVGYNHAIKDVLKIVDEVEIIK